MKLRCENAILRLSTVKKDAEDLVEDIAAALALVASGNVRT